MAAPTFSLGSLPVEIQCCIFRHLDPMTLIAMSQTSSHYRQVVSPSKLHHAERLLALELTQEHGGTTTIFRPQDNSVSPDWRDPGCASMRWTCTSCLHLLPHTAFSNHALLGLGYRKPEPDTPAAEPVSTWESSRDVQHWRARKQHQQRPDVVFEQKRQRAQYAAAAAADYWRYTQARDAAYPQPFRTPQPPGFEPLRLVVDGGQDEMARTAREHEQRHAGQKRRLRRCLECSWRRGELRPRTTRHDGVIGGSLKVPLAHSRQLYFGCGLERYFPGFAAPAGNRRPARNAPVFVIYRENARDLPFTLHMVRCPRCATWQELRAFRVGEWSARWTVGYGTSRGEFQNWDKRFLSADFFDGLVCNHCLAADGEGASAERLRDELRGLWMHCAQAKLQQLMATLTAGFYAMYYATINIPKRHKIKRIIRREILPGILGPHVGRDRPYREVDGERWEETAPSFADLALYRLRYGLWQEAWARYRDDEGMEEFGRYLGDGFRQEEFDLAEEHFRWLHECRREVLENPQVLVDWALARDGAALT